MHSFGRERSSGGTANEGKMKRLDCRGCDTERYLRGGAVICVTNGMAFSGNTQTSTRLQVSVVNFNINLCLTDV